LSPRGGLRHAVLAVCVGTAIGTAHPAVAGTVVLKKAWVEKYKDRATIEADMLVDDAHPKPNTPKKDSDLHFAGRAKQVGLPMVAEIMNAAGPGQTAAVKLIHDHEQTSNALPVIGAWRFWFEHPPSGGAVQKQKFTLPAGKPGTNPPHVFEIHPVTRVKDSVVGDSLIPIVGYDTKDAVESFTRFKKLKATVTTTASAMTVQSPQIGFNYVEFEMRALGPSKPLVDGGRVLLADALDDDGEVLAESVRMVFLPDTKPKAHLDANPAGQGDELRVVGIPRVNLNGLYTFAYSDENDGKPRQLPYEMIIVGIREPE
jgi:hypothetical protein